MRNLRGSPTSSQRGRRNRLFVCPMWQAGLLTILFCENKTLRTQILGVRSPAEQGTGDIQRVCRCKPASGLLICRLVSGRCPCSLVVRAPGTCSPRFTIPEENDLPKRQSPARLPDGEVRWGVVAVERLRLCGSDVAQRRLAPVCA